MSHRSHPSHRSHSAARILLLALGALALLAAPARAALDFLLERNRAPNGLGGWVTAAWTVPEPLPFGLEPRSPEER